MAKTKKNRSLNLLAKWLGVGSAIIALILWLILANKTQFYPSITTKGTWIVIALMILLAIFGVTSAITEKPFLMILVFLLWFFPVGLYMLGLPSIFRLIGFSNLLFFISSIVFVFTKYEIHISKKT